MVTYLLAAFAASLAATGGFLQHQGLVGNTEHQGVSPSILLGAIRRPRCLAGIAVLLCAFTCQFLALRQGSLAQVQPMLSLELVVLLILVGRFSRVVPGPREWFGVLAVGAGLAGFLASAGTTQNEESVTYGALLIVVGSAVLLALVLATLASRQQGSPRAALLGTAAASCFAAEAGMIKAVNQTGAASATRWIALALLAGMGALGFLLFTHALAAGPVFASRTAMVITNPLVSVFLGVVVFGDSFGKGFLSALGAVLGLLVMSSGVWLLSSSSLVRAGEEIPSSAA